MVEVPFCFSALVSVFNSFESELLGELGRPNVCSCSAMSGVSEAKAPTVTDKQRRVLAT